MPTLLYMIDFGGQIGLSIEKASFLATVHGFGQVVGVLVIMPLSDYLGRKKTIIISNFLIAFALIGIVIAGNSWQKLYLLVGCCALFYGATFPLYGACAGDYFPKKVIATVAGAWTFLRFGCHGGSLGHRMDARYHRELLFCVCHCGADVHFGHDYDLFCS